MASQLPVDDNLGMLQACVLRAARLGPDCTPLTGADMGIVTTGIMSMSLSPEQDEGTPVEPNNGCGGKLFTYRPKPRTLRWNVTGEIGYYSPEAEELLFGGEIFEGAVGHDYAGDNIAWAPPDYTDEPYNGIYLEVISKLVSEDAGECVGGTSGIPPYVGRLLGKVSLVLGDQNQQNDHITVPFTGTAERNPNLGKGPWGDAPIVGNWSARPVHFTYYTQDEYDTILAEAAAGYVTI